MFEGNFTVDTSSECFVFIPGMIAIHKTGRMAAGTSTNGIKFKIPGSVLPREQLSHVHTECKPYVLAALGGANARPRPTFTAEITVVAERQLVSAECQREGGPVGA